MARVRARVDQSAQFWSANPNLVSYSLKAKIEAQFMRLQLRLIDINDDLFRGENFLEFCRSEHTMFDRSFSTLVDKGSDGKLSCDIACKGDPKSLKIPTLSEQKSLVCNKLWKNEKEFVPLLSNFQGFEPLI